MRIQTSLTLHSSFLIVKSFYFYNIQIIWEPMSLFTKAE